jgi:hypothetical protein
MTVAAAQLGMRRVDHRRIGHNLPQEAPQAFAQAVVDVDTWT